MLPLRIQKQKVVQLSRQAHSKMIEAIRDKRIYTIPENTDPELMINRARGKPTEQSSTATPTCAASKAVDGNSDPVFAHHSCSQTLPRKGSWWQVDLQVVYDIRAVVLSSTTDNSCKSQLLMYMIRLMKTYPLFTRNSMERCKFCLINTYVVQCCFHRIV